MPYHIDEENSELVFEVHEGNKLTIKLKTSTGGGGSDIYLIKVGDETEPTDKNTFSASRILDELEKIKGPAVSYWELKEDSTGSKYISTKYDIVSERSATFYSSGTPLVPSIFERLPLDGQTIGWVDGVIKVLGGTGGGEADSVEWNSIKNKPGWIGDAKPGYSWGEIGGKPSWIGEIKPSYSFDELTSHPTTLAGYGITDAALPEDLKKYVTLDTEQTISALKTFSAGLNVGTKKLYEKDGVVYLDGDLALTGALTLYAQGGRAPSTILDGLAIDETTLSKAGGKLSVVGGVGGASNWDELEGKPSWIGDAKPTYAWSEIGSKPSWITDSNPSYTKSEADGRFVNNSGDTVKGAYIIKSGVDDRYLRMDGTDYELVAGPSGWSMGLDQYAPDGATHLATFGFYGEGSTLNYAFIGKDYANPWLKITGSLFKYNDYDILHRGNMGSVLDGGYLRNHAKEYVGDVRSLPVNTFASGWTDSLTNKPSGASGNWSNILTFAWNDNPQYKEQIFLRNGDMWLRGGLSDGWKKLAVEYEGFTANVGSNPNTWCRIASLHLNSQYLSRECVLLVSEMYNMDNRGGKWSLVYFSMQQQNPLGQSPAVAVSQCGSFAREHIVAMVNYNNSGSYADLYIFNVGAFNRFYVKLLQGDIAAINIGSPSAGLPNGSRVESVYEVGASNVNGVPLMGFQGRAGLTQSTGRGRFTTVNQYFGNGNVVVFDPAPTDSNELWANTVIFSLGDQSSRNHQLAFGYPNAVIKHRVNHDGWKAWQTIAYTSSNVASATKLQTPRVLWGNSFDGTQSLNGSIQVGNNNYIGGIMADNDFWGIRGIGSGDGGVMEIWTGDNGNEQIVCRQYPNTLGTGSATRSITLMNVYGDQEFNYVTGAGFELPDNLNPFRKYSNREGWVIKASRTDNTQSCGLWSNDSFGIGLVTNDNGLNGLYVNSSGNVGMGTLNASQRLHVIGNILASGGVTLYSSDQRAKTIIGDVNVSLKDIANSPAIRFRWNGWKIEDDGKIHVGGIAQYVEKLIPELVIENEGFKNLDYATTGYIFSVLTAKHLQKYETKTDREIRKLKARIKELERRLE